MFSAVFVVVATVQKAAAGSFVLYYEGYPSTTLSYDASEADVRAALSAIPAIQGVDVTFSIPGSGACNSAAINVIQVGHTISPLICEVPCLFLCRGKQT